MTADAIIELLERAPFEPFRICLSSGESYEITNPHLVALQRTRVFIAMPNSDRQALVSYPHISALETISNGRAHGRGRRRR